MHENEQRSHDWLIRYAHQELNRHLPRHRRYLDGILAADRPLRVKELVPGTVDRYQAYDISRGDAALIGRKAFLWRTPGTTHYQNPAVAAEILQGLAAFRSRQSRAGDFIMGDAWNAEGYLPHHEHAWRLEPMIWARIWLEPQLSRRDRAWIDAMIARAARRLLWFARTSPNDTLQYCNRGVIWCAVTTLAGLYLDQPGYLREVERHAERIITNTITARGEVLEGYLHYSGGGPDTGYSLTTIMYAVMYRLLSGRTDLDGRLVQAHKWAVNGLTRSGWPLAAAASVRYTTSSTWVCDILPGLELFADREPYFATLAGQLLGKGGEHDQGHCLHPFIWAMLSHCSRPSRPRPAWHCDHEGHYEHQPSQYSIIRHRYQAGITWRGLHPGRGLQSFALDAEAPLIHPTAELVSTVMSQDADTAMTNLSAGPSGWEIFRRNAGPGNGYEPASPATFIITRKDKLWECYAFTRDGIVYAVGGPAPIRARWVLNHAPGCQPCLDQRTRQVTFPGRQGRISWLAGTGRLAAGTGDWQVLEVEMPRSPAIFSLGSQEFRLERFEEHRPSLHFRDSSGRYTLNLNDILGADSNLDRSPENWQRLARIDNA